LRSVLVILQNGVDAGAAEVALAGKIGLPAHCTLWDQNTHQCVPANEADLIVAFVENDLAQARAFLRWLGGGLASVPVLVVLPDRASNELFRASFEIADDVITLPLHQEEFNWRLERLLPPSSLDAGTAETRIAGDLGLAQLIGCQPDFQKVIQRIPVLAASGVPVLITGETGTGKELSARAIHNLSRRRSGSLIAVDCAAIPEQLFENEFFGHARGAYTDARVDQKGLAALAAGGTLFLDEVDVLPLSCQAKLLRFLEERAYRPLGSDRTYEVDVRIVAATNNDLEACARAGRFRKDLVFRLDVLRLQLPPLRERKTDIGLLADHFLNRLASEGAGPPKSLSQAALSKLWAHDWPGNVRELFNVLHRAAVSCDGPQILPVHLSIGSLAQKPTAPTTFREARDEAIKAFEKSYIQDLLRETQGNITHAARQAAKDRRVFGRLVKKHHIDPLRFAPRRLSPATG